MVLTVWTGVVLGAVYALVAFGFTISMIPSGIFNFAQGAIVALGIYLTSSLHRSVPFDLFVLVPLNAVVGALLGVMCEVVCVRPLRRSVVMQQNALLATVGLSTALVGVIGLWWGYLPRSIPSAWSGRAIHIGGIVARPEQIVVLLVAVVSAGGLNWWYRHTPTGRASLAAGESPTSTALRGVNVDALVIGGFAAAGAFGAASAIAIAPLTPVVPNVATTLALGGFVAIALGGPGRFVGCLAGGIVVGVTSTSAARYIDADASVLAVLALLLVVLWRRPSGLGGAAMVRDV